MGKEDVKVYTVAIGQIRLNPLIMKRQKEALQYIQGLNGFIGFHPVIPYGTLCLFKTENDAKGARNLMRAKGIETGKNIGEVFIDKEYIKDKGAT